MATLPASGVPTGPQGLDGALSLAHELAEASGAIIRRYFRQTLTIEDKADLSPVTRADRESEAEIRRLIGARFPAHGIIGEEYGDDRPDAEFVWVLDPIDGTKSFISGVPLFGTLIALLHQGRPILGVLDQPISRERWIGATGRPSTHNGTPIRTRECAEPAAATLFSTSPDMFRGEDITRWDQAAKAAKLVRYGADCYAYGLLALGFCDSVIEADLKLYDFAAHIPIIEGAGGIITNWQGSAPGLNGDGRIIAAGDARLHAALVEILSG